MKLLYLINHYPKVSHTFIRREILAFEEQGVEVQRLAMRSDDPVGMSEIDKFEHAKTHYVLQQSKLVLLLGFLATIVKQPKTLWKALKVLFKMNRASKQNILLHLIYLLESTNVAKVCRAKKVNHIHAHFGTNPTEVAMYTSILTNTPYSFTVHGPEEFDKPLTLNLNEKIKHAHSVMAITNYCRSQLFRWADYRDWKKIKIVRCGLEQAFFTFPEEIKSVTTQKSFLCIGRLCEQKGQLLLIEAFKDYLAEGYDATLTLAGDGEMREIIEQYVQEYNIVDKVNITGWVDSIQIKALLNESDAMLLPSFAEGLPVAIMEAMATGVPIISTSIAGIPELVKHKETGFLITPGSIEDLTSSLVEFSNLKNDEIQKIKQRAFEAVSAEHSVNVEVQKIASIVSNKPW